MDIKRLTFTSSELRERDRAIKREREIQKEIERESQRESMVNAILRDDIGLRSIIGLDWNEVDAD